MTYVFEFLGTITTIFLENAFQKSSRLAGDFLGVFYGWDRFPRILFKPIKQTANHRSMGPRLKLGVEKGFTSIGEEPSLRKIDKLLQTQMSY